MSSPSCLFHHRPDVARRATSLPQWEQLHSPWMYLQCLICYVGPPAHLFNKLLLPLALITLSVLFNVVWYCLRFTLQDHDLIPIDKFLTGNRVFTLSSFAIAVLLTFRLNRTYERWQTSSRSIMRCTGQNVQIVQVLSVWVKNNDNLLNEAKKWAIASIYSCIMNVLQLKYFPEEAAMLLSREDLAFIESCPNSTCVRDLCTTRMRMVVQECKLTMEKFLAADSLVTAAYGAAGEAIFCSYNSMPLPIRLLCSGFLLTWLILLPFGMFSNLKNDAENNAQVYIGAAVLVICYYALSIFLLCIDRIATDLEFPFEYISVYGEGKDSVKQIEHILHNKKMFDAVYEG